jgi:gamma-glutamylcyclotransferase (GGCT)/AIG2-like uncharacterized protein YtfP
MIDRLASYGSLAPGRVNHHQLAGLKGRWLQGRVHGKLFEIGWGAALGYLGLILDPSGPAVEVQVFESPDIAAHWARLDEFEGAEYRRVLTGVHTAEGVLSTYIYVVAE